MVGSREQRGIDELLPTMDDHFRRFFMGAADMLAIISVGGRYLEVNNAFEAVLGYSRPEITGSTAVDFVHPDDQAIVVAKIEGLVRGQCPESLPDIRVRHKEGHYRWVAWTASHCLPKGEIYVVMRDVTEHREDDEKLRSIARRFHSLLHDNPHMIALSSLDGRYLSVNEAFLRTLGYRQEQVVGRRAPELGLWISQEHRQSVVEELLKEGAVSDVEMTLRTSSGEIRYGLGSARLTELDGEQIILSMVLDYTERKRAEMALRESEQRLHNVFAWAPIGMCTITPDGIISDANPALTRVLGMSVEEIKGKHMLDLTYEADREYCQQLLHKALSGPEDICRAEKRMVSASGNVVWGRSVISVVRDAAGVPQFLLCMLEDITAERKANQEIQRLAAIVSSSDDAIVSTDLESHITSWNPAAERMFGYTSAEACGKPIGMIIHPASNQQDQIWQQLLQGEHVNHFEAINLHKDGATVNVTLTISPLFDPSGKIIGATSICRDITGRKQMEQELARLDRLNLVGEMAAGISHEVRNPMTTVRGFLQLMGQKSELAGYKEYFNLMIDELDRCNAIISEFLSLGSVKAVDLRSQDLNDVVRALSPLIEADAMVHGNQLKLDLGPLPAIMLDEKEIRQLILNLVRNGYDAMPGNGTLTITTTMDESEVVLSIRDEGSGIPDAIKDKIGNPFFTTKDTGTGLGLPVCYSIAARHKARIDFDSSERGTTFRVHFPAMY